MSYPLDPLSMGKDTGFAAVDRVLSCWFLTHHTRHGTGIFRLLRGTSSAVGGGSGVSGGLPDSARGSLGPFQHGVLYRN